MSTATDQDKLLSRIAYEEPEPEPEKKAGFFFALCVFLAGLVMGTGSTVRAPSVAASLLTSPSQITIKMVYSVKAANSDNNQELFEKP